MITHTHLKRLIHEQYPNMQEDVDRGGMAAYISDVAIDAALLDKPSATGNITSFEGSQIAHAEGRESIELRRRQVGTSASYLRLPYTVKELGDLESKPDVGRSTDNE